MFLTGRLDDSPPGRRPSRAWMPSDEDVDAYLRWKGNAAAAWRERAGVGAVPALRTFQAGLARRFAPGDRATVREGVEGRRRHQVYLRWEPEARNELWEADHKELDVPVLFPRAQRPRKPWATLFVDGFSRAVMGWVIAEHPSTASVLAALGEAIRVDPRRGPFGGVPAAVRADGGLEFAAQALEQASGVLAVRLAPAPPYSPHLKAGSSACRAPSSPRCWPSCRTSPAAPATPWRAVGWGPAGPHLRRAGGLLRRLGPGLQPRAAA